MSDATIARSAAMLAALSQPTRLRIVAVVVAGDPDGTPAGDIARAVHCPASTLSFHLKELTQAGLLAADPQGRFIRYSVVPATFHELSDFVRRLPDTRPASHGGSQEKPRRKPARKPAAAPNVAGEGQMSIFDE